ncbi:UNVERIFIED_CONTAM: LEAF RUST 10 DISEASE-RESISTANCE LOCUS RECEPTOR-LIKE PROTEIN KINASE-like 1.2 [Sesamum radiatum]|uniref:LEAF RUST 10 DISEASE-RESISTANCE LOCUS RECEPTOR-LIKE PROTEIN KINASE-like 1.2 n=1 Tax=Sesamum radiatum TaxID=300843 RepID=A0AAW2V6U9_SESRA
MFQQQESYCGFPGFVLNCSRDGFPVLNLSGNDYMVENISYRNRSLHVLNAAVLRSDGSSCLPRIRNTSLDSARFDYVNVTGLRLFSNCTTPLPEELLKYKVGCNSSEDGKNWDVALYDKDENLRKALETCDRNVVAPVEGYYVNERIDGMVNLGEELRTGICAELEATIAIHVKIAAAVVALTPLLTSLGVSALTGLIPGVANLVSCSRVCYQDAISLTFDVSPHVS